MSEQFTEEFIDPEEQILEESDENSLFLKVDPGQSSIRLDSYIHEKLSKVSRNKIQNAIELGLIKINGLLLKSNYKVKPGDLIEISFPENPGMGKVLPEKIPLDIIYEDDDLMLINKASGMVVHPAHGNYTGTLINAIAGYLNLDPEDPSTQRYGLVHRIDKETSGLLVLAKNDYSHAHLSKQFFNHTIDREYWALVWGEPSPDTGTIDVNIGRDPRNRQRMYAFSDGTSGKKAITHYQLLESFYYTSLISCKLETGRTHQIRVHMKFIGNPLFNDERYGGDKILKGTVFTKYKQFIQNCYKIVPRFPLHARLLAFTHPKSQQRMRFEIEPPGDFLDLLSKWRQYQVHRKHQLEDEENLEEFE